MSAQQRAPATAGGGAAASSAAVPPVRPRLIPLRMTVPAPTASALGYVQPGDVKGLFSLLTQQGKQLEAKRRARVADVDASHADQLTWEALTADLTGAARFDSTLKSLHGELIALVRGWVGGGDGGEVSPAMLYHCAHLVFQALSELQGPSQLQVSRRQLESSVGRCRHDKVFADAVKLCRAIKTTRDDLKPLLTVTNTSGASTGASAAAGGAAFGANVVVASAGAAPPVSCLLPSDFFLLGGADDSDSDSDDDDDDAEEEGDDADDGGKQDSAAVTPYSYTWLLRALERFATFTDAGAPIVSEHALAESAQALLASSKSDAQLQGELVDLLGFEAFDLVGELLEHRAQLRQAKKEAPQPAKSGNNKPTLAGPRGAAQSRRGVGISITTNADKAAAKEARRIARRFFRQSAPAPAAQLAQLADPAAVAAAKIAARAAREKARAARNDALIRSLDAFKHRNPDDAAAGMSVMPSAMPTGTTRERTKEGWEVVRVPPPELDSLPEEDRVPVSAFSALTQPALRGITRLNALQSRVFPCAYGSNNNMLVCAPTGAGKTNVALMTVLREVDNAARDGLLQTKDFKVVYVAPMKALATEVTAKFRKSLSPLGLVVRELTGDMQLTKKEIAETQMLVTTPEKWDVVTRKAGDGALISTVRLLILDEVHLLHEERGPVLEVLVARTMRHVEVSQQPCRIVGLSATLPNYTDVSDFLGVHRDRGLFAFDARYRPVPLDQYYIGVGGKTPIQQQEQLNKATYQRCVASLKEGNQVMVFAHSRNDTAKVARALHDMAVFNNEANLFTSPGDASKLRLKAAKTAKNPALREVLNLGMAVHHAGLTRPERDLVEQAFTAGEVSVLVCTATLAWGVNLPAHTVILRGTQIYDPKQGGYTDVSMLDVMQIFGRAGRPQFDSSGEAVLITAHDKLPHYLGLLCSAMPIESRLGASLADHLNAEIVLGTVTSLREAEGWLAYSYLYVRMRKNPTAYGIDIHDLLTDPALTVKRRALVLEAAKSLMACRMVKFDYASGNFFPTDVGRVASVYYIHHESVDAFNHLLKPYMQDEQVIDLIAHAREFAQLACRNDEAPTLSELKERVCPLPVLSGLEAYSGKANVLLQCYISGAQIQLSTLMADSYYVQQNAARVARALFEMVLRRGRAFLTAKLLEVCKMIERRVWGHQHPLRQFIPLLPSLCRQVPFHRLESQKLWLDELTELSAADLDDILGAGHGAAGQSAGAAVTRLLRHVPWLSVDASAQPLTRDVLRVTVKLTPEYDWRLAIHGPSEHWWVWCEDANGEHIYHHEALVIDMQRAFKGAAGVEEHTLAFTIPISDPPPAQYVVRVCSDRWLGSDIAIPLSFKDLMLPEQHPPHTDLLRLAPLPVSAVQDPAAEALFRSKFTHFNPIQTQAFHALYHSDTSVLLGAPTGSGKTVIAELAILRALRTQPGRKIVYVAPMKALARERTEDWGSQKSLAGPGLGVRVVELTGDASPDPAALRDADLIITTPEKWDGVSRHWHARAYVSAVSLMIIDEIHLLGQDRGPVLEVIVSRMRYVASQSSQTVRVVGLSTALSNAKDVGDWLGIDGPGLFNFHPIMRPVPLTVYVSGFPGRFYCPRMATMNKPCYAAIATHSPTKPVLVFVASRRQTRLTALDLVSFAAADGQPRRFLRITDEEELERTLSKVKDASLKHLLAFGVGLHHAGLPASDRVIVEELFVKQKIQVLLCTATLAWGVNFPAHLVIVKGTEYFDAKTCRYVDFPVTDVLQMMGRAGRPQFDTEGKACVMVHEPKKPFYHKFLHSPFPVESSLPGQLHNHLCAEVAAGTIKSVADAVDWLSWTFFFRRLLLNPSYYGLADASPQGARTFLLRLITRTLGELEDAHCVTLSGDSVQPTSLGAIAAYYYVHYKSIARFCALLTPATPLEGMLNALVRCEEYADMPVRHNEDVLNASMIKQLPTWYLDPKDAGESYVKTSILFQARFAGLPLPISDYGTDTKTALDQSARLLHALVDVLADAGWLAATLRAATLAQMVAQAQWAWASPLAPLASAAGISRTALPALDAAFFKAAGVRCLPQLLAMKPSDVAAVAAEALRKTTSSGAERMAREFARLAACLPRVDVVLEPDQDWLVGGAGKGAAAGKKPTAAAAATAQNKQKGPVVLRAGEPLRIGLTRRNPWTTATAGGAAWSSEPLKVTGPKDVKARREGWWIVVGREDDDELICMKRVTVTMRKQVVVADCARTAEKPGKYVVMLVSDSYLGLDQQYEFEVLPAEPAEEEEAAPFAE